MPREKRRDLESPIQEAVVKYLEFALPGTMRVVGVSNNPRSAVSGAKEKRKGMKAGFPDLLILGTDDAGWDVVGLIEVKTEGGRLSKAQSEWKAWCEMIGLKHAVCRSIEDARETLEEWGWI
jgi:hypothetical protein